MEPIPNAPAPADTPPGRDRQARWLAERFSADLVDRKNGRFHLRLLTSPLIHTHDPDHIAGGVVPERLQAPVAKTGRVVARFSRIGPGHFP